MEGRGARGRSSTRAPRDGSARRLERYANPIIVGEPTGSSPNFVAEDNFFPLPYSKMAVSVSDLYWQASWPQDERIWIAPLLHALPTWDSYRKNVDPAIEAVKRYTR